MAHATPSAPRDDLAVIRKLKFLVALLVFSNVTIGIMGIYLLKVVDDRYTRLIERSVPLLSDLQTLTAKTVEAMRSTNPVLHDAPERREASVHRSQAAFEAERAQRAKVLGSDWGDFPADMRQIFVSASKGFSQSGQEVLALYQTDRAVEAGKLREVTLRPDFDRYLRATTKAADIVERRSLRESDGFTAKTSSLVRALLGFAGWPVFVVVAGVLFSTSSVALLLLAWRARSAAIDGAGADVRAPQS